MQFSVIQTAVKDKSHDTSIDTTMLKRWINNGYQDVVNKLITLYENFFGDTASISIVADTQEYDLDSLCRKVIRVENEEKDKIFRVSVDDNDENVTGYYLFGSKIGFKPIPSSSNTYKYFMIKQPVDLSGDTDVPNFPSSYHYLLVLWGLKEYYERQQDTGFAIHYFNQYNAKLAELINEMKERNADEHKYAKPRYGTDEALEWND